MIVKAAMVQFMLEQRGFEVGLSGNPEANVLRIRLAPKERVPDATLVVQAKAPKRKPRKTCACLHFGDKASDADALKLLEAANDCIMMLQAWDSEVMEALLGGMPLAQFVLLGQRVLPYPYGFYDANSQTLGASSNFAEMARKFSASEEELALLNPGDLPVNTMINLYEDLDYLAAFEQREPFYYRTTTRSGEPWNSLCVNVLAGNSHVARLVIEAPLSDEPLHPGAEQLAEHFSKMLKERLVRATVSAVNLAEANDSLHEAFREIVFDEQSAGKDFERVLLGYGWRRRDSYVMVKFVFFKAVQWDTAAPFICGQLEQRWRHSVAIHASRSIVWILNKANPSWGGDEALRATVAEIARAYACRAGISGVSNDFFQVQAIHRECIAAMDIGKVKDPHFWYYSFDNYSLDYALAKMAEDLPVEAIVSKKIAVLKDLDEREGTEYIRTLRCYIDNKLSATPTAKALFMHRTSFLRKLERIERLSGINFNDPDELLHVVLSLRLIG